MPNTISLGEICNLQNGYAFKSMDYSKEGHFVIRITNVQNGIISLRNPKYIKIDKDPAFSKYILNRGDILISLTGNVGRVAIINDEHLPCVLNQRVARVTNIDTEKVDIKYLFHNLQSTFLQKKIEELSRGTAQANVSTKDILSIKIELPKLSIQKNIIKKLNLTSNNIYKANSALIDKQKNIKHLKSSILFSKLNNKSEEWKTSLLKDVAYTAGRIGWKGLTAKEYVDDGPLFLSVHSLNHGDYVDFSRAFHITQERYDESPEIKLKSNDILICKDGAGIGKVGIVKEVFSPSTINGSLLLIRSLDKIIPKYLYYYLISPMFQKLVKEKIDGATTPHLYQREIKYFPISYPSKTNQEKIVLEIESLIKKSNHLSENYSLMIDEYNHLKSSIALKELFEVSK